MGPRARFARLLLAVVIFPFDSTFGRASDDHHHNSHVSQSIERSANLHQEPKHHNGSPTTIPNKGHIEGFVIPPASASNAREYGRAEVRLMSTHPPLDDDPHVGGFLRASAIVMEYDEDTRQYMLPKGNEDSQRRLHRLRHRSNKHRPSRPFPDAANDSPIVEHSLEEIQHPRKLRTKLVMPVRAFIRPQGTEVPVARRRIHPTQNYTWIVLHSPAKIYIPVRYNDEGNGSASKDCVLCSPDLNLTASRGESTVQVPIPTISLCARLARKPGRMHVAVTVGPRPGHRVSEGAYLMEMIVWKSGGYVYACNYTLTVIVKKCANLPPPEGGFVDCSNGTVWGSRCYFTCHAGYALQGHRTLLCEGTSQEVTWSAQPPICKKVSSKESQKLQCLRPKSPSDGTVVCDSNGKAAYPDGSVCQFFCYPGFLVDYDSSPSALIVCKNGQWTPTDTVSCIAAYCSEPQSPNHGTLRCNRKQSKDPSSISKFENGTSCHIRCNIGHVIPTSMESLTSVVCVAPSWNDSTLPECKRAVPPIHHPDDCRNQTLTTRPGRKATLPSLPRFVSHEGHPLKTTCSLEGEKLPKGLHFNFCEATDPELKITTTCKYYILVEERFKPRPHPKDCKDQVRTTNRRGTVHVRAARFVARKKQSSPRTILHANCTYVGELKPGIYTNNCTAWDPDTNMTGHCSYTITVKERSCPPPAVLPHASIECDDLVSGLYPPQSVCKYVCDDGYVMPISLRNRKTRKCHSNLKWKPVLEPFCKRAIPPRPRTGECLPQILYLPETGEFIRPRIPRFKSSMRGSKVRVTCSLNDTLTVGSYTNVCEAEDRELELRASCKYAVVVKATGCPLLPSIGSGYVDCSGVSLAIGTTCTYQCHAGHVIPTSQQKLIVKECLEEGEWNSSFIPSCVGPVPPSPMLDSCLDRTISVPDLSRFELPIPEFESSGGLRLDVSCLPLNVTYGIHNLSCTAFDPELRVSAFCEFLLDVQNPTEVAELEREEVGCVQLESGKNGDLRCRPNSSSLLLVGSVCEVTCHENYIVPVSQRHLSAAECLWNTTWNVSRMSECVQAQPPVPHFGCEDQVVEIYPLEEMNIPRPQFLTANNLSAEVSCYPSSVTEYGPHEVSCTARDTELESASVCSFNFTILDSRMEEEPSTTNIAITTSEEEPSTTTFITTEEEPSTTIFLTTEEPSTTIFLTTEEPSTTTFITAEEKSSTTISITTEEPSTTISITTEEPSTTISIPTTTPEPETTTTADIFLSCRSLVMPTRASVICMDVEGKERCRVQCDIGYGFSSDYSRTMIRDGWVECDGSDGLWDFERIYGTVKLPECLGQLEGTTVQVWLSFKLGAEQCDDDLELKYAESLSRLLISLNDMCTFLHCNKSLRVDCSVSDKSGFDVTVNWTLQADYDPDSYEDLEEVTDVETHLETVLETTQKAVSTGDSLQADLQQLGLQLKRNSFSRGHINLFCPPGYSVDLLLDKCVECPSGSMELNGMCIPCSAGRFQARTGQTICVHCPSNPDVFFDGNVPATCTGSSVRTQS